MAVKKSNYWDIVFLVVMVTVFLGGCQTQKKNCVLDKAVKKEGIACPATAEPESLEAVGLEDVSIVWPERDDTSPDPHTVFGNPVYSGHDDAHNILREYGAFSVYYDDEVLGPRWTAIKLTRDMADANSSMARLSKFKEDPIIKNAGYQVTKHDDYKNLQGQNKWDRGHIVQFDDARGYGDQAGKDSFYTCNVCPQLGQFNQRGWLSLEKTCTEFARDYEIAWVYSGPIYGDNPQPFEAGRIVPSPEAFYKIVVSPGINGQADVLAFILPHEPIPSNVDLSQYLVSVDEVEEETGIDFLQDLPDAVEDSLESAVWEMWPDLPDTP